MAEEGTSPAGAAAAPGGDPSMEDILASIRRILNEDEPGAAAPDASGGVRAAGSDRGHAGREEPEAEPEARALVAASLRRGAHPGASSLAPRAIPFCAATAASPRFWRRRPRPCLPRLPPPPPRASIGSLVRAVSQDRDATVNRGGPSIEDVVREEVRPLLKYWLDQHLPEMVERLVRAEIERVVRRGLG